MPITGNEGKASIAGRASIGGSAGRAGSEGRATCNTSNTSLPVISVVLA